MSSAHVRTALRVAFLLAVTVSGVAAQDPIGRYIIDLRGSTVSLSQNEELAALRELRPDQLAPRLDQIASMAGGARPPSSDVACACGTPTPFGDGSADCSTCGNVIG